MPCTIEAETADDVEIGQLMFLNQETGKLEIYKRDKLPALIAMENYKKGDVMEIDVHTGENRRL